MRSRPPICLLPALLLLAAGLPGTPARAEDGAHPDPRVFPVSTPLPVGAPGTTVPMTGDWNFSLTHGMTRDGAYQPASYLDKIFTGSPFESDRRPAYAFDGDTANHWVGQWGKYPQHVEADLGADETVSGIELVCIDRDTTYAVKVEGSRDGQAWTTLAEKPLPGVNSGPLNWEPTRMHYLRLVFEGAKPASARAALWECFINVVRDGTTVHWQPAGLPSEEMARENAFADPAFDDKAWKPLKVPSNWEIAGWSPTTYNWIDDTVGLYRRWVDVPASFQGRRIFWRFDGVFDGAEIFINGKRVAYHESGWTGFDVDVTGFVLPGQRNFFAVRVCKDTSSFDLDTGDYEALGGIYRNTFLFAVPPTHISDITIRTPLDPASGDATLTAAIEVTGPPGGHVQVAATLADGQGRAVPLENALLPVEIGPDGKGRTTLASKVAKPLLWSAEKPNLYKLALAVPGGPGAGEQVEQPFGFREITTADGVLLWNGVPIKCAGMCRHDIYPTLGAALTDEVWNKDAELLHGANVNAIRTSHYNQGAHFLDLCDQTGFYVLDEVPFCWIKGKVDDPRYIPAILQRLRETVARDKNRPSVLAWSLGNENPLGKIHPPVLAEAHRLDPTRPAFVSFAKAGELKGQSLSDHHYPYPNQIPGLVEKNAKQAPMVFSEQPHIFYQSAWQAYDPGVAILWGDVLDKSWTVINHYPGILGSFIWEWQDQPVLDSFQHDGGSGKGMRWQNNKGVVTGDRQPKPEWWEVKMVYSPVHITSDHVEPAGKTCAVAIDNRYSFTDLKELACQWEILSGDQVLRQGTQEIACPPLQSVTAQFPALPRMTALRLTFRKPDGGEIVGALLHTLDAPQPVPALFTGTGGKLEIDEASGPRLSNDVTEVRFDQATGQLSGWRFQGEDLLQGPGLFNLGQEVPCDPGGAGRLRGPGPVTLSGTAWKTEAQESAVTVTAITAVAFGADKKPIGTLTTVYTVRPDAQIAVRWNFAYTGAACVAWEIGEKLSVPERLAKLSWHRDARFLLYPSGHMGAPEGNCMADDRIFRSSKRNLHWLTLTDNRGAGLALLQLDAVPLIGRGGLEKGSHVLWASLEEAAPDDVSHNWVMEHDVHLDPSKPLSGGFLLRPVVPAAP